MEIVRNVDPAPCGDGNPGLEICAGKANPDYGDGWSGAGGGSGGGWKLPGKKQVAIQDAFENLLNRQAGAGDR